MNARILRMLTRLPHAKLRIARGLGQLQPVTFHMDGGFLCFSAESVASGDYGYRAGRPCLRRLYLPTMKAEAKRAFAELERCRAAQTDTPAHAAYKALKAEGVYL